MEYQNNDPTGMPFIPRHRLTKEPRYVNYDLPQGPSSAERGRYLYNRG